MANGTKGIKAVVQALPHLSNPYNAIRVVASAACAKACWFDPGAQPTLAPLAAACAQAARGPGSTGGAAATGGERPPAKRTKLGSSGGGRGSSGSLRTPVAVPGRAAALQLQLPVAASPAPPDNPPQQIPAPARRNALQPATVAPQEPAGERFGCIWSAA